MISLRLEFGTSHYRLHCQIKSRRVEEKALYHPLGANTYLQYFRPLTANGNCTARSLPHSKGESPEASLNSDSERTKEMAGNYILTPTDLFCVVFIGLPTTLTDKKEFG